MDSNLAVRQTYVPEGLVPASQAGLSSYYMVSSVMIDALRGMAIDARSAGAALGMVSAYRDYH